MKRHLAVTVTLVLGFLMCFMPGISQAQEEEEVEYTEYSYGTVVSVSSSQIVVNEYDYDRDEEVKVTYTVDPKAIFENVSSLKDISAGDVVEIDYVVKEGKNIAKIILVEKLLPEEEKYEEEKYEPSEEPSEVEEEGTGDLPEEVEY